MLQSAVVLCLAGFPSLQEPSEELQRRLGDADPGHRRQAAIELAGLDQEAEEWLLDEIDGGGRVRRRALLLAAALMGTPKTFALVEKHARKGTKADNVRAYSLFLYAAFHPEAAENAHDTLRRAYSDFERCCAVAGLLAQARSVNPVKVRNHFKNKWNPTSYALVRMLEMLGGKYMEKEPKTIHELSACLLGSVLPEIPPVPAAWIEQAEGKLPLLWQLAANRVPPRDIKAIRAHPQGGEGAGMAMVLYELVQGNKQSAFESLQIRLVEDRAQAWLWGAAGDLGLNFPGSRENRLAHAEIAGILRLARRDFEGAKEQARIRHGLALEILKEAESWDKVWPAAVVLALAATGEDVDFIRQRTELSEGAEAERLQPILLLASGRMDPLSDRAYWLNRWARELSAGYQGYLDQVGRLWTAYLLVSGTEAVQERLELSQEFRELEGPRDHSFDDELYADLAELVLSDLYRWDLP